jgi:hypothetical protein
MKKNENKEALIDTGSQISIEKDKFTRNKKKSGTNVTRAEGSVITGIVLW